MFSLGLQILCVAIFVSVADFAATGTDARRGHRTNVKSRLVIAPDLNENLTDLSPLVLSWSLRTVGNNRSYIQHRLRS
jgi:hypothetical protein